MAKAAGTTTPAAARPEPTLAELRSKLAPKRRPEPSAEQKDKEARTVAVQTEVSNFSDRLIGLASTSFPDGTVEIDDESEAHLRKALNYLDLASKATVAAVKAISPDRYVGESAVVEGVTEVPDDLGL